jgi:hypothetical protein
MVVTRPGYNNVNRQVVIGEGDLHAAVLSGNPSQELLFKDFGDVSEDLPRPQVLGRLRQPREQINILDPSDSDVPFVRTDKQRRDAQTPQQVVGLEDGRDLGMGIPCVISILTGLNIA